ncbi:hypothetical protein [Novilysobacter defluvii]|uniref:Uncharacterized protein n=1 Tax=Lysobacter defluvii IMMIB APB-9 = DSM 18482 TaxID=1385515 RepID=A0A0A0MB59_9GAMM|nr:hypothetical protein [Lysobacter defluvii]KGO99442.1 hypothetical protein N791_07785 [Lysobacter defluvii IMMIB APB-9 = DSM 18482]
MAFSWSFKEATPGDRARESQVEKFFSSDAVRNKANAVVREGIQNSLDAASEGEAIHVRITLDEWSAAEARERLPVYERGFVEHSTAEGVRSKIATLPGAGDPFRFMVFEDFGTSGLKGDPAEWWPDEHGDSGAFFKYFRAEGMSGKADGARGRHGVGRLVFMFASRTRTMYGLTRRDGANGPEELLMGTSVLRNHRVNSIPYLPDGWFGVEDPAVRGLTLPITEKSFIDRFKRDFMVTRDNRNGLSVVVPWLAEDVTLESTVQAVLAEYYYPILAGKLTVEVASGKSATLVDRGTLDEAVAAQPLHFTDRFHPLLELARAGLEDQDWLELPLPAGGAPKWSKGVVSESHAEAIHRKMEEGERIFIRVPVEVRRKNGAGVESEFRILLERDPTIADSLIQFVREGIIVSDVRPRRTSGIRALVVVEKGALGEFLGDSENPSHTQWQKDVLKEKYTYAPALLEYVVQCVPCLLAEVSQQQKKPDASLLLDLFALPAEQGIERPRPDIAKPKPGADTWRDKIAIERRPRRYSISRRGTGFVVRRGDDDAVPPAIFSVRVAYDVRRGNPFNKYVPADFELGKGGVDFHTSGCEVTRSGSNWAVVRVLGEDFEFGISGFDIRHRDLHVDVRVTEDVPAVRKEAA